MDWAGISALIIMSGSLTSINTWTIGSSTGLSLSEIWKNWFSHCVIILIYLAKQNIHIGA